jgi:hypothetical protein
MTLGTDNGRPALTCAECKVFVRLLRRRGDPELALELDDVAADVPPKGSWWIGFVRGGDGIARPVALAQTLGSCWSGVLACPLRGVIIMAPCDPPKPAECQAELTPEGGR